MLRETKTIKGYTLLKDELTITIPMEMTKEEVENKKIDVSKAIYDKAKNSYNFYNLTYEIGNATSFEIPMSGGAEDYHYLIVGLCLISFSIIFTCKRKKN
ncbi:hypothetical protein P261_02099 [Lachnospiraceae bacterium TWA4]|nr:hypothetical protein P261_02099 [Lachnospiraceae bacterium TWA4]